MRRFGPLLGPDSERYEAHNAAFRTVSVLSTRLAPSLDAARSFARIDRMVHIAAGGWWYDSEQGKYVHAGPSILRQMSRAPKLWELLGLNDRPPTTPGELSLIDLSYTISFGF